MVVIREAARDAPSYATAQYFREHRERGARRHDNLRAGSFLVRTKLTTGGEDILLGPNRLIIA